MSGPPSAPPPAPPPGFPVAGAVPFLAPVPPPWTQHKAPNGAPYWFNPITNVSTYVRPAAALPPPPPPPPGFPIAAAPPPAPALLPALHYTPQAPAPAKKKEKKEKPKLKTRLGETNWIRVVTNKGNVFYNDSETKQSVWTVPEEVKHLVEELEQKEREEEAEAERAAAAAAREEQDKVTEEAQQQQTTSSSFEGTKKKRKADDNGDDDEEREEEEDEDDDGQERGHLEIEIEVETEGGATSVPVSVPVPEERPPVTAASGGPPPAKKPKLSEEQEEAASTAPTDESSGGGNMTTNNQNGGDDKNETSSLPPPPSSKQEAGQAPQQKQNDDGNKTEKKKKKKQKPKVVSSLEDLADEDWQRQIADEMAREAEAEAEAGVEAPGAPSSNAQPEQRQQQAAGGIIAQRMEVDQVEAAALFTVLLSEKEINPMAPFETELPKFVTDPRYHAVKGQKERRDLFDQFCKDKIREQRAAKRRAAESGTKVDPLTAYRQLLSTTVTSTRTHFSDFKRQHAKDARFREFGKTEGEREKEFKKWLRELGVRKRAEAERAEREFVGMLQQDGQIKSGDKWTEVKKRHASDPRYAAVSSSSLREQLFEKHLASLASSSGSHHPSRAAPVASTSSSSSSSKPTPAAAGPSKEDKAARAAASLREREEKVRLEKMRNARSAERARGHLGKDEAEREFAQLLVDAVRDHNARFDDVAPSLAADPRFDAPSLHPSDKRRLFDAHQQKLYRSRVGDVESLFGAHASSLTTPFDAVLPAVSSDPHVTRLVGSDFTQLESLYDGWLARRTRQAREDFTQMLKENSVLEHWGRMKKMEKREKGKLIGEEGVREDSEDEEPDAREMAEQIDLKAIHAVLRNDKRYLEFDHVPEDRERWVEDYVNNLAAPKTTVHQRE